MAGTGLQSLLILGVAFGSTLLGSMSGGSSSLLSTAVWITLGFPLPTAVACDKVAGAFWTLLGSRNYLRGRPLDRRLMVPMGLLGLVGVYFGTRVTVAVDPALLKRVVGGAILTVVLVVALRPRFGLETGPPRWSRGTTVTLGLPLGFYEGLFGSGNSIAATIVLCVGRGFDLVSSLGHYYLIASGWCGFAAVLYAAGGHFSWQLALPATVGAVAGGYLGSRLGSAKGTRFVRVVFILAGVVLGAKLVTGF